MRSCLSGMSWFEQSFKCVLSFPDFDQIFRTFKTISELMREH